MPASIKRNAFFDSEAGKDAKEHFLRMMTDNTYDTASSYTSNSALYPDNQMPFVDRHMNYLSGHPNVDTSMYITNIRLRTRIR